MIGLCLICGDNQATVARTTLTGKSILALCSDCSKRLRRAALMSHDQLEHARDEAHVHLAVIAAALHPSQALAPIVSRYRTVQKRASLSASGQ